MMKQDLPICRLEVSHPHKDLLLLTMDNGKQLEMFATRPAYKVLYRFRRYVETHATWEEIARSEFTRAREEPTPLNFKVCEFAWHQCPPDKRPPFACVKGELLKAKERKDGPSYVSAQVADDYFRRTMNLSLKDFRTNLEDRLGRVLIANARVAPFVDHTSLMNKKTIDSVFSETLRHKERIAREALNRCVGVGVGVLHGAEPVIPNCRCALPFARYVHTVDFGKEPDFMVIDDPMVKGIERKTDLSFTVNFAKEKKMFRFRVYNSRTHIFQIANPTLKGAVAYATLRAQETGEEFYVVQVVRAVRRKKPAVEVEVVK